MRMLGVLHHSPSVRDAVIQTTCFELEIIGRGQTMNSMFRRRRGAGGARGQLAAERLPPESRFDSE
jgi:hypothetical protein